MAVAPPFLGLPALCSRGSLFSSDWARAEEEAKGSPTFLGFSVQVVTVAYGPPSRRASTELLAALKSCHAAAATASAEPSLIPRLCGTANVSYSYDSLCSKCCW